MGAFESRPMASGAIAAAGRIGPMPGRAHPRSVRGPRRRARCDAAAGGARSPAPGEGHHPDLHEGAARCRGADAQHQRGLGVLSNPASSRRLRPVPSRRRERRRAGHWAASRSPIQPASPSSTRTWATWRATAAETRAAPRTVRQPGEIPTPANAAPAAAGAAGPSFRDSGWAAVLAGAVILVLLLGAVVAGRLSF